MNRTNINIKKIPASHLRIGMHVHDLNCDWMSHPFLRSSFDISSKEDIRKIMDAGIREVYINAALGMNARYAPTKEEIQAKIERDMIEIASPQSTGKTRISFNSEFTQAMKIRKEATQQICAIMNDARLGKVIELDRVEPVVHSISASILRNPSALICLLQLKNKDNYTFLHSISVCALMIVFCKSSGMDADTILQAGVGGLLHDIGKSKVHDSILNKQGPLTDAEYATMKEHSRQGHDILSAIPNVGAIPLDIVLHHHERHDGSGYPEELPGHEISTLAQMAAIVDVYDAITADRSYHKGMSAAEALRRIYEWSEYHFNPQLVQTFIRCIGIYPVGTLVLLESGRLGVVVESHDYNLLEPKVNVFFSVKANAYIKQQLLDLSKPFGMGGGDRITSHESPEKWGVDPMRFIHQD